MEWILIQPEDDVELTKFTKSLLNSGEYMFDLGKDGVRLHPVRFGTRVCTYFECKYHSYVG